MVKIFENEKILLFRLMLDNWSERDITSLNEYQKEKYNIFWDAIDERSNFFFDAKDRRVGKTYLINELGLELQALGYRVYVITPVDCLEYYAERKLYLDPQRYAGMIDSNTVILLDEVFVSENFSDFIDYCRYRQVSVIGFVRYPEMKTKPINFEREYECKWVIKGV